MEGKAAGTGSQPGVFVTWQEGGGDKKTDLSGGWNKESRRCAQDQGLAVGHRGGDYLVACSALSAFLKNLLSLGSVPLWRAPLLILSSDLGDSVIKNAGPRARLPEFKSQLCISCVSLGTSISLAVHQFSHL